MSAVFLIGLTALGGGAGAALRYAVDEVVTARWQRAGNRHFPLGTFMVNVTGSLALGLLVGMLSGVTAGSEYVLAVFGTGLLGGYTTFSTASLDAVGLVRSGHGLTALGYAVGTMIATVVAAVSGLWLGGV